MSIALLRPQGLLFLLLGIHGFIRRLDQGLGVLKAFKVPRGPAEDELQREHVVAAGVEALRALLKWMMKNSRTSLFAVCGFVYDRSFINTGKSFCIVSQTIYCS